jgi:hypothetical protein
VPASLGDAVNLLQKHAGRAKVVAGGHSLIPMMKLRLATPEFLIDIGRIPELSYVKGDSDKIKIGALTTHFAMAQKASGFAICGAAAIVGKPGFVKGEGTVQLTAGETGTLLTYSGDVSAGGPIASLGQRMTGGTARMVIDQFFKCVRSKLGEDSKDG